jgi:hypothetical protein
MVLKKHLTGRAYPRRCKRNAIKVRASLGNQLLRLTLAQQNKSPQAELSDISMPSTVIDSPQVVSQAEQENRFTSIRLCSVRDRQAPPSPRFTDCQKLLPAAVRTAYRYKAPLQRAKQSCVVRDKEAQVRFAPCVEVAEIPCRQSYAKNARKRIWSSFKEIKANARRSRLEYQADGGEFWLCREESEFIEFNGELLHPTTYWKRRKEENETSKKVFRLNQAPLRTALMGKHLMI